MVANTSVKVGTSYVSTSKTTIHTSPLELRGGIGSLWGVAMYRMSFTGQYSHYCNVGSWVYTGKFSVTLPPEQFIQTDPLNSPTTIVRYATIPAPNCWVGTQPGIPYGHTITMRLDGAEDPFNPFNLSPATITATMDIKVV